VHGQGDQALLSENEPRPMRIGPLYFHTSIFISQLEQDKTGMSKHVAPLRICFLPIM